MAIAELETRRAGKRLDDFCDRVPPHARDQMSYDWKLRGDQITLFERRPVWRGEPGEFTDTPLALFRFDPAGHHWSLRWPDRNGHFHPYDGLQAVRSFDRLVDEIESDPTGIFLG